MYSKKSRNGKTLQSGRKVGVGTGGLKNPKRTRDLRTNLSQTSRVTNQGPRNSRQTQGGNMVDARQKIATKKSQSKPLVRSISLLEERRKEQRQKLHQQNRSLTLSAGGNIHVTARQEVPPDRMATMMGDSIRITAKVERRKEDMDRQANVIAGFLTITAKNEDAQRKEKEHEARKRARQNEAYKRERERDAKRKQKEAEHALYSQIAEESVIYASNASQLHRGSFGDGVYEGNLDHSLQANTSQSGKTSLPGKEEEASSSTRVTVSNLHPAVTQQDVEELFGVVGGLRSCKMLGRGCAEVVYAQKNDALLAIRRYHNRKLDGQPMECKLDTLPSASLYSPPPARYAPLAPLRPLAKSTLKPLPSSVSAGANHRAPIQSTMTSRTQSTSQAARPVVFKVKI